MQRREPDAQPKSHAARVRDIYDYWLARFHEMSDGDHRIILHDGRPTEAHRLMAAIFGLLRAARADGYLVFGKSGDDMGLDDLAKRMGVSKPTAIRYLDWMEDGDCLTVEEHVTSRGYPAASKRCLVLPIPSKASSGAIDSGPSQASNSTDLLGAVGPRSSETGSEVKRSSSPADRLSGEQEGDIALPGGFRDVWRSSPETEKGKDGESNALETVDDGELPANQTDEPGLETDNDDRPPEMLDELYADALEVSE